MKRPEFLSGSKVVIRRGTAKGTADPKTFSRAQKAYTGDCSGARGVVVGSEVRDGIEVAAVCVTDSSADGRATGILDVPVDYLRHRGMAGPIKEAARHVRRFIGGAGKSRVLHGNAKINDAPQPVPPSPYASLVTGTPDAGERIQT